MRLWTIDPEYLDARGLVALWREGLLARAVLRGRTVGYRNHPQLERFRSCSRPVAAINSYLAGVLTEAKHRGYRFDESLIGSARIDCTIAVTAGQLEFEWQHLLSKLVVRDPGRHAMHRAIASPRAHHLFQVVDGPVAPWERVSDD